MGSLGCPECSRTPVIYSVTQKMWFCRSCRYTWREEDGRVEPVYWVPEKLPERERAKCAQKKDQRCAAVRRQKKEMQAKKKTTLVNRKKKEKNKKK